MKKLRVPLAFGLAFCCVLGHAQSIPEPKEFYFDQDPNTTRAIIAVQGDGDVVIDKLAANLQRRGQDVESRAQLAHIAMRGNRIEMGNEFYRAAQQNARSNARVLRTVSWNYAWDLYRTGQPQAALEQWIALIGGWPATPSWQPPTMALALWSVGRRDEAVKWYAAAVRTEPAQWSDTANFPRLLPDWSAEEHAVLAEIYAAWVSKPPTWP